MKDILKNKKILILTSLGILISILIPIFISKNITLQNLLKEKPQEVVIANITTSNAEIYWKVQDLDWNTISYKEKNDTGLYKDITDLSLYTDYTQNNYIYRAILPDLEPNKEYVFKIETENNTWEEGYTFQTKNIADEIAIPEIVTEEQSLQSFVLVDIEGEKLMLDTQYHGTLAFDSANRIYTVQEYGQYITREEIQAKLWELIPSPVYAESGANCQTGITNVPSAHKPSKATTIDIINRNYGSCLLGGYPETCYEDVYCQALRNGVHPAFAITMWTHESSGSNYAAMPNVQDFGINGAGVPNRDFEKQIDWFMDLVARGEGYIAGCNTGPGKTVAWGAKYYQGDCTTTAGLTQGRNYISNVSMQYEWFTGKTLTWPFTISKQGSACNYSSAATNTSYNTCSKKGEPSTTPGGPTTPTTPTPPGGDGVKDYMVVTGTGVTPKDRDCIDPDGCICLYGYTNNNPQDTLNINYGYTCTIDKQVIPTPDAKVCCYNNNQVSMTTPTQCTGTVLEDVDESSCKLETKNISLTQGVNFIEATLVMDKDIDTARKLIEYSGNKIIAVGLFRNDQWEKVVKYENGNINGKDFNLDPGYSYLVVASEDIDISTQSIEVSSEINLTDLKGWNLIPTSVIRSAGSNTKSILQNASYTYIKQIAVWDNPMSIFSYTIRDNDNSVYGDSISLYNEEGIFIKIP